MLQRKPNMYSLTYQLGENQEVVMYSHNLDKLKKEVLNLIDHFSDDDYEEGLKVILKDPNGTILQSI